MHANRLEPPRQSDIKLDQVDMSTWRVYDARLPEGDAARALGTIARSDEHYLASGSAEGRFGSLSAATAAFAAEPS